MDILAFGLVGLLETFILRGCCAVTARTATMANRAPIDTRSASEDEERP